MISALSHTRRPYVLSPPWRQFSPSFAVTLICFPLGIVNWAPEILPDTLPQVVPYYGFLSKFGKNKNNESIGRIINWHQYFEVSILEYNECLKLFCGGSIEYSGKVVGSFFEVGAIRVHTDIAYKLFFIRATASTRTTHIR